MENPVGGGIQVSRYFPLGSPDGRGLVIAANFRLASVKSHNSTNRFAVGCPSGRCAVRAASDAIQMAAAPFAGLRHDLVLYVVMRAGCFQLLEACIVTSDFVSLVLKDVGLPVTG